MKGVSGKNKWQKAGAFSRVPRYFLPVFTSILNDAEKEMRRRPQPLFAIQTQRPAHNKRRRGEGGDGAYS